MAAAAIVEETTVSTRRATRRYFPELEGMRGFAALGVLTTHVAFSSGAVSWNQGFGPTFAGYGFAGNLLQQLRLSLPIFFVLSGMLLYRPFVLHTLADTPRPALRPYLWRRALRTLPAYWVVLTVALVAFNRHFIHRPWQVIRPFLLLHVYSADERSTRFGTEHTWSLATEVAFYAALPLLAWALHRFARQVPSTVQRARRILIALIPFEVIGFLFTIYSHLPSKGIFPMENEWPLSWLGFIAAGMALATLSAAREVTAENVFTPYSFIARRPLASWAAALAVYLVACVSPIGHPESGNYPPVDQGLAEHVYYLAIAVLLVAPLTVPHKSAFIQQTMTNPVTMFFGRISYGVYLWHIPMIYFWYGFIFGTDNFGVMLVKVAGCTIVAATLSYVLIESPAMRLRERLGKASVRPSVATISN